MLFCFTYSNFGNPVTHTVNVGGGGEQLLWRIRVKLGNLTESTAKPQLLKSAELTAETWYFALGGIDAVERVEIGFGEGGLLCALEHEEPVVCEKLIGELVQMLTDAELIE